MDPFENLLKVPDPPHWDIYICIYNTQFLTQPQRHSQTPGKLSMDQRLWFCGLRKTLPLKFLLLENSAALATQCPGCKPSVTYWPPSDIVLTACVCISFWEKEEGEGDIVSPTLSKALKEQPPALDSAQQNIDAMEVPHTRNTHGRTDLSLTDTPESSLTKGFSAQCHLCH